MSVPGYWMHETSGVLRPAVDAYLHGEALTGEQIAAMRAYCRQWVMSSGWDQNPHADDAARERLAILRRRIDDLVSRPTIEAWIAAAVDMGMDPL
jgi:hypothetical protein